MVQVMHVVGFAIFQFFKSVVVSEIGQDEIRQNANRVRARVTFEHLKQVPAPLGNDVALSWISLQVFLDFAALVDDFVKLVVIRVQIHGDFHQIEIVVTLEFWPLQMLHMSRNG